MTRLAKLKVLKDDVIKPYAMEIDANASSP